MLSNGFDLNEFHPISMMRYMQSQYSEDEKNSSKTKQKLLFFHLKMSKAYAHRNSKTKKQVHTGTYLKVIQMNSTYD